MVTDHDVSTDDELIWRVAFDDGDECDLNEEELTAVMLPPSLATTLPPMMGTRVQHPRPADVFPAANDRALIASSSTIVPTPLVEEGISVLADCPHAVAYRGRDCGVPCPFPPPSLSPLTHGAGRVYDNPDPHSKPNPNNNSHFNQTLHNFSLQFHKFTPVLPYPPRSLLLRPGTCLPLHPFPSYPPPARPY